eukprot:1160478-Pelagomonas_calceolata.AAC.1
MLSSASSAASAAEAAKATLTANAATAAAAAKAMAVVAAEAATAQHMADSAADKATADEATADKATAYLSAGLSGGQASSPPAAVHSMQVGGEVMTGAPQCLPQRTADLSDDHGGPVAASSPPVAVHSMQAGGEVMTGAPQLCPQRGEDCSEEARKAAPPLSFWGNSSSSSEKLLGRCLFVSVKSPNV